MMMLICLIVRIMMHWLLMMIIWPCWGPITTYGHRLAVPMMRMMTASNGSTTILCHRLLTCVVLSSVLSHKKGRMSYLCMNKLIWDLLLMIGTHCCTPRCHMVACTDGWAPGSWLIHHILCILRSCCSCTGRGSFSFVLNCTRREIWLGNYITSNAILSKGTFLARDILTTFLLHLQCLPIGHHHGGTSSTRGLSLVVIERWCSMIKTLWISTFTSPLSRCISTYDSLIEWLVHHHARSLWFLYPLLCRLKLLLQRDSSIFRTQGLRFRILYHGATWSHRAQRACSWT